MPCFFTPFTVSIGNSKFAPKGRHGTPELASYQSPLPAQLVKDGWRLRKQTHGAEMRLGHWLKSKYVSGYAPLVTVV
jgi:hypothetical protein